MPLAPGWGEYSISAYYTGEFQANAHGGLRTGSALLSDAGILIDAKPGGRFAGGRAFTYVLWNNRETFSNRYVGDLQGVSNIDAEQALRVYELWYEQHLGDDVSLRFGLYDLNAEFDVIPTAAIFVNSSHGIGAEYGQSGRAGPSIFPVTSLAARFELALDARNAVRYAILDGVPGDPDDSGRTTIDLGGGDGVLHALEYNHTTGRGLHFGIGGWMYSADFDRLEATPSKPRNDGNRGIYGFVDAPVYSGANGAEYRAFLRYGIANDEFNVFDSYAGAGAVVTGLIASRPGDGFGVAFASARVGDAYDRATGGADSHETSIELTYRAQVTDWLRVQPGIQRVLNPGADPGAADALVVGLRFELAPSDIVARE